MLLGVAMAATAADPPAPAVASATISSAPAPPTPATIPFHRVRVPGGMLITASGMDYEAMRASDLVLLGLDGTSLRKGQRVPSSEWHFHAALYAARPEAGAVVHAHAPFATTLATPV